MVQLDQLATIAASATVFEGVEKAALLRNCA